MNKKLVKLLSIFVGTTIIAIALSACGLPKELSEKEWPKTKEKAIQVTVEHIKNKNNIDVTIDEVSFSVSAELASYKVYLEGHVVGNENKKIAAVVDTSKENYQVINVDMDA
ncbi:hypothetical protein P4562_22130 [Lysinibacillus xylanilyticus]|uniref:hypothetical protein n=1 Tax=Lysinibacillus xylanilyticus TaxID=582475 RepID=UPI002E1C1DEE|nr:hypothetical protein [Lysinibacillus xylanilyticus]